MPAEAVALHKRWCRCPSIYILLYILLFILLYSNILYSSMLLYSSPGTSGGLDWRASSTFETSRVSKELYRFGHADLDAKLQAVVPIRHLRRRRQGFERRWWT